MEEYKITSKDSNQKIEKYIKKTLNNTPLSLIYKLFRKKDIKVNGKWVNKDYIVKEDDIVRVYLPNNSYNLSVIKELPKLKITFDVLYEDKNILVVNKPTGLLVHDDNSTIYNTLTNQVLYYLNQKNEYNSKDTFTPGPCHRLDRNTSGIVIFGKTNDALRIINDCLKNRVGLEKYYKTLVKGTINKDIVIEKRLLKDEKNNKVIVNSNGLEAITEVHPLLSNDKYSLLEVHLKTGRTHQIRVHLASIGHEVIGDKKYGDFSLNSEFKKKYNYENQFLHAYKISFTKLPFPLDYLNGTSIESILPSDKQKIIDDIFK